MKVRERIEVILDLFLGALHADRRFDALERRALEHLLCDLLLRKDVPPELALRIERFSPDRFDLEACARDFRRDPPMCPRRMLELVLALCFSNGEYDLEEDEYLHCLGRAFELDPLEYDDLVLDYEVLDPDPTHAGDWGPQPNLRSET